jgi:hypothetical protein
MIKMVLTWDVEGLQRIRRLMVLVIVGSNGAPSERVRAIEALRVRVKPEDHTPSITRRRFQTSMNHTPRGQQHPSPWLGMKQSNSSIVTHSPIDEALPTSKIVVGQRYVDL